MLFIPKIIHIKDQVDDNTAALKEKSKEKK